ncbi:DUF7504 family protein [Halarchaeum sp. P4]|uniref:DUF7504 family protein n=1 Tax=Halarchaeum sp. P4 TaxID=3421639 RepID=UPI003EB74AF7
MGGENVLIVGPFDDVEASDASASQFVALVGRESTLESWQDSPTDGDARVVRLADSPGEPEDAVGEAFGDVAALGNVLDTFAATTPDPTVYVDSVDALAAATTEERAFRFVHLATRRVADAGGTGYFRVRDGANDAFVRTLEPLFDDVRYRSRSP